MYEPSTSRIQDWCFTVHREESFVIKSLLHKLKSTMKEIMHKSHKHITPSTIFTQFKFTIITWLKKAVFHLKPLSIRPSYGRASPRDVVVPVRLIIWRPFKLIFFKLLGLGEVWRMFLRVRAQVADNFLNFFFLPTHLDFER